MTDYDPNLPQEFAHMPKRRGAGPVTIVLALLAVFLLSALVAVTRSQAPAPQAGAPAEVETGSAGEPQPQAE